MTSSSHWTKKLADGIAQVAAECASCKEDEKHRKDVFFSWFTELQRLTAEANKIANIRPFVLEVAQSDRSTTAVWIQLQLVKQDRGGGSSVLIALQMKTSDTGLVVYSCPIQAILQDIPELVTDQAGASKLPDLVTAFTLAAYRHELR